MHILDKLTLHMERAAASVFKLDGVRFTKEDIPRSFLLDPRGVKLGKVGAYAQFRFNLKNGEKVPITVTRQRLVVMTIVHKRLKASKPGYKTTLESTNLRIDKLSVQVTDAWLKKEARKINGLIKTVLEEMKTLPSAKPVKPSSVKPTSSATPEKRPKKQTIEGWLLNKDGSKKIIDIAENKTMLPGWSIVSVVGDVVTVSKGKTKRTLRKWLIQNPTYGHSAIYGEGTKGNTHLLYETSTEKYVDAKEAAVFKLLFEPSGSQTMDKDVISTGIKNKSTEFFIHGEGIQLIQNKHAGSSYNRSNNAQGYNSSYVQIQYKDKMGWPWADPSSVSITLKDVVKVLKRLGLVQSKPEDWAYTVLRQRGGDNLMLWNKKAKE